MPCRRGLPAPVFEDKRTAFLVKFYQRTPIEVPLADEEQRILAYVKKHGFIRRAEAQEQAEKRGAPVLEVEPARGGGSYVLQRVLCGKPPIIAPRPAGSCTGRIGITIAGRMGRQRAICGQEPD